MQLERSRKISLGREKLAAYRRKKRQRNTPDSSLAMEGGSDGSLISEHVGSSGESVENDRSLQEIEIRNVPDDVSRVSEEDATEDGGDGQVERREATHQVQSILEEILRNEQFKSDCKSEVSYSSLDQSLNVFENLNVDDASLECYFRRQSDNCEAHDLSEPEGSSERIRRLEELLAAKDSAIAALQAELESVKEIASNQSTMSCPTSTEYKQCQEELQNRVVEFQNAVEHRDDLIQQLTESLQQSLAHREELQRQSEKFAAEIIELQRRLVETSEIVKQHKCEGLKSDFSSLSDVPSELRELFERYVKKKLEEMEENYKKQIEEYKNKMETEISEIKPNDILELRNELETRHAKEMEELRTYFEQKCADLEKHYSEEIFSQQSRRMSGSSSCSELASDLLFSGSHPHPGPSGDSGPSSFDIAKLEKKNSSGLSKKDLLKLKEELEAVSKEFAKYNLEKISKHELNGLKSDLSKFDFHGLAKYDLANVKSELQNKYHAELEILREDYENRIDVMNVAHENKLQEIERKYAEEIDVLKYDLAEALKQSGPVQEVVSSGEFEITEVVQSYERRLQEQVALAKLDIIATLESQIQKLAASESDDEEWPSELLRLKDKFAERYEERIAEIKEKHQEEIDHLKEEHHKILSGALERARKRSLREDSLSHSDLEIMKDRDNLKKSNKTLRHLISELMKYFTKCEDELNNTLVDELLKQGFDKSITQIEGDLMEFKRVHITPDFTEVLSALDASLDEKDVSSDLKNELELCLEKLKSDANAILALTVNLQGKPSIDNDTPLEEKIASLKRQLLNETHQKNELNHQLSQINDCIKNLEDEKEQLEHQNEMLIEKQRVTENSLKRAHEKIAELIEHKEVVSEGYGEQMNRRGSSSTATFAELQERARALVSECEEEADNPILLLLEDLCKEGDRMAEERKKEREDLMQQIEAADKKYRATCHFLEEQASEREQERDEAQREITELKEQLKEREKDRASCERVNSEVEHLEQQMREMSLLIEQNEARQQEIETDRREAIEKIHVLRDIIRDLEAQVETKTETEAELRDIITQLENVIKEQRKTNEELSKQLDNEPKQKELREHIVGLEEEVRRLRLNEELIGSEGVLKQVKNQLLEFETSIDKRTQDLEGLHATISSTSCSSPTEDMSIKDQVMSKTPDECEVPLQQLARLKEKLIKHSRAEDAAMKRIRDLEMQFSALKEVQHERDALQEQVTEQLVLISSLQIRLDEQRLLAEDVQRQTNTSLEVKIYDLESEIQSLREALSSKDKTIKQLNNMVEQTKKRLEDREKQLRAEGEDEIIVQLRKQVQDLQTENILLENSLKSNVQSAQILPNLVDNIIADKNADIEKLKDKLSDTQRQLEMYLSLNLDRDQLKSLSMLRGSDRALGDILSLIPDQARHSEPQPDSIVSTGEIPYKRSANETIMVGCGRTQESCEISSIERVSPSMESTPIVPEKRVHFEDTEKLNAEILELKNSIHVKDEVIKELSERLKALEDLQKNVEKLQIELENTEKSLQKATESFEKEHEKMQEVERALRVELAEKKMHLQEKQQLVEALEQDSGRKDQMYINLTKEKQEIEKQLKELQSRNFDKEIVGLEEKLSAQNEANNKLLKELENKARQVDHLTSELAEKTAKLEELDKLKAALADKECEVEILNEDLTRLEQQISSSKQLLNSELELHSAKTRKEIAEKDLQITNLKNTSEEHSKEIAHLQELLSEKDKIIQQMSEDSKSLHVNLETIQNKIQETGNIVDLARRLRDEQKANVELQEEIHGLKAMLLSQPRGGEMAMSIEEITGQVRRELDYSAHLDSSILSALEDGNQPKSEDWSKEKEVLENALKETKQKLEAAVRNVEVLQEDLEREKQNSNELQIEDAKLIEQMRIRLDAALDNEIEFQKLLETEKQARADLEAQIARLKRRTENVSSGSYTKTELTEYKSLPTPENMEMLRLQKESEKLLEENMSLKAELKTLKRVKRENDANLKYVKDMFELKAEDVKRLEEKIAKMADAEVGVRNELLECRMKLEQKQKEVDNSRLLIDEIEEDRRELKKQLNEANEKLRSMGDRDKLLSEALGDQMNVPVPEKLMKKIKELKSMMKDNKQMTDTLVKLTDERRVLQERIVELENRHPENINYHDLEERTNHLFGRYLRAESYRKALIWQKRYLVGLLETYQNVRPVAELFGIDGFKNQHPTRRRLNGLRRFRSAVYAVVAISRLQFVTRRWHSGVRNAYHRRPRLHVTGVAGASSFLPAQRTMTPTNEESLPWSGSSPPSRDLGTMSPERSRLRPPISDTAPLIAPDLLSRYIERFNQIQNRLGIALDNKPL